MAQVRTYIDCTKTLLFPFFICTLPRNNLFQCFALFSFCYLQKSYASFQIKCIAASYSTSYRYCLLAPPPPRIDLSLYPNICYSPRSLIFWMLDDVLCKMWAISVTYLCLLFTFCAFKTRSHSIAQTVLKSAAWSRLAV